MLKLSVGSKVFLMGEYLALQGGPSVVASFSPRFELCISKKKSEVNPFHPQSPAGIYLERNKKILSGFEFNFIDPHLGRGGWGASSAQFGLLAAFTEWFKNVELKNVELKNEMEVNEVFIDQLCLKFRNYISNSTNLLSLIKSVDDEYLNIGREQNKNQGSIPSGFDLLSQLFGSVYLFDRKENRYESFLTPNEELFGAQYDFLIFHTGVKVATHIHLNELQSINYEKLKNINLKFIENIKIQKYEEALCAINEFRNELKNQNLELESTTQIIEPLLKVPGVKAVKGCGALGADLILVVFEKSKADVKAYLKKFTSSSEITSGFLVLKIGN